MEIQVVPQSNTILRSERRMTNDDDTKWACSDFVSVQRLGATTTRTCLITHRCQI